MGDFASRKFLFGIVLTICATVFVVIGKATVSEWMAFEAIVGGTYTAGNLIEKAIT